jgi:hypothetical protein
MASPVLGRIVREYVLLQPFFKLFISRPAAALESAEGQISKACGSDMILTSRTPHVSSPLRVFLYSVVYETDDGALSIDNDKTSIY